MDNVTLLKDAFERANVNANMQTTELIYKLVEAIIEKDSGAALTDMELTNIVLSNNTKYFVSDVLKTPELPETEPETQVVMDVVKPEEPARAE